MPSETPELPCALHWSEGMLLSPQHFQQFEKYVSARDFFWASAYSAEAWGVLGYDYDRISFAQDVFKITSLKAAFPDGTLLDYEPNTMPELSLDFSDFMDELQKGPLKVSVKVPRSTDPNLVSADSRYQFGLSTQEADEQMAHNNISVERKTLNVSLGAARPTSAKYFEIPVAEFGLDGSVPRFTDYHPPAFRLLDGSILQERLEKLLVGAREKLVFLSDFLKGSHKGGDEIPHNRTFLAFRMLCQNLPELEACSKQNRSPAEIFLRLTRLSGSLSFLNDLSVPPAGGEFDVNSLTKSFAPHIDSIETSLSKIQSSFKLIDMKVENNVYSFDLAEVKLGAKAFVVIENKGGLSDREISNLVDQALIGEQGTISGMLRKRTLGAKRALMLKKDVQNLGLNNLLDVIVIEFDGSLLTQQSVLEIQFQTVKQQPINVDLKLFIET